VSLVPDTVAGLSGQEAARRLREAGFNELPSSKPKNLLRIAGEILREPMLSLLAILIGWIIIVPPFVSIYRTGERIAQMQEDAGMERSCNGWIGLVLSFFVSLHALYYQSELNRIWARLGQPEEGSLVALPVAVGAPSGMPNGTGPAAQPETAQPQAARSGGAPGLRSDGTSAKNDPADGDSSTGA